MKQHIHRLVYFVAAISVCMITVPAWAGFSLPGYDLQVVKSEQGLANAAADYQTNGVWNPSGTCGDLITTSFTLPSAQTINYARLYLDVWGGSNYKSALATVTVNGTTQTLNFGTTSDANSTFDPDATCVYGSGSGAWQLCLSNVASLLYTDGTANSVSVTISDPDSTGFDGRVCDVSLVSIYQDPSINQTLDYYLAEADGTLRKTPGSSGSPSERSLTISGIDTADALAATYTAGYTHGTTGQLDQLFFNSTDLDGSSTDIALGDSTDYGPSNHSYDVLSLLLDTSTIRYSVTESEVGSSPESYLRANVGLLTVVHSVPEPSTVVLLTMVVAGGLLFVGKRRK